MAWLVSWIRRQTMKAFMEDVTKELISQALHGPVSWVDECGIVRPRDINDRPYEQLLARIVAVERRLDNEVVPLIRAFRKLLEEKGIDDV